jgi:hypothetical protein
VVAKLEKTIFQSVENAFGDMRSVLKKRYSEGQPFSRFTDEFVKDFEQFQNLGAVERLLTGKVSESLQTAFHKIVTYRNFLAHGERFLPRAEKPGTLLQVVETLEEVIMRI